MQERHTVETHSEVPRPRRTLQTLVLLRITVRRQRPTLNPGRHLRTQQAPIPLATADLTMPPPLEETFTLYLLLQMFILPLPLQPLHQHRNFPVMLPMRRRHLVGSQKHRLHGVGTMGPDMRRGRLVLKVSSILKA